MSDLNGYRASSSALRFDFILLEERKRYIKWGILKPKPIVLNVGESIGINNGETQQLAAFLQITYDFNSVYKNNCIIIVDFK